MDTDTLVYTDPALGHARTLSESDPRRRKLPPDKIVCVNCPAAIWMWTEQTDAAKKNAIRGLTEAAGWRCWCRTMSQPTYDDYAASPDSDGWVFECTARYDALLKLSAAQAA